MTVARHVHMCWSLTSSPGSRTCFHHGLQHLPVFLQKSMEGETDSQLVNSVYLDNRAMELYHGRLDKTPGAIALRFR